MQLECIHSCTHAHSTLQHLPLLRTASIDASVSCIRLNLMLAGMGASSKLKCLPYATFLRSIAILSSIVGARPLARGDGVGTASCLSVDLRIAPTPCKNPMTKFCPSYVLLSTCKVVAWTSCMRCHVLGCSTLSNFHLACRTP